MSTPAAPQRPNVPRFYNKMRQVVYNVHICTSISIGQPRVFSSDRKMQWRYTCCDIKNKHLNHIFIQQRIKQQPLILLFEASKIHHIPKDMQNTTSCRQEHHQHAIIFIRRQQQWKVNIICDKKNIGRAMARDVCMVLNCSAQKGTANPPTNRNLDSNSDACIVASQPSWRCT